MTDDFQTWRKHGRLLKEARLLLREARRLLHRNAHRLSARQTKEVGQAVRALSEATAARNYAALRELLKALDDKIELDLGFARKSPTREYIESIAVAILIALFLRAFVVEAFKIPSGSMIPTLQVGDQIFVNKFIYGVRIPFTNIKIGTRFRRPRRGEVIVFIYPKNPEQDFIKRIVAVEGDTVEVKDNVVYVNDQPVERHHESGPCRAVDFNEETDRWIEYRCDEFVETVPEGRYTTIWDYGGATHSWPKQTVPPDSVFVMGDNRDKSHDSRFWGFVPDELIKGKAMIIWFSHGPEDPTDPPIIRFFKSIRLERMRHLVH